MKTPKGLTNKITLDNGVLTKISNKSVDYFLNRRNESKLYDFFSTLDAHKSVIIKPLAWGYNSHNEFYSQFKYLQGTYTFEDQPNFSEENLELVKIILDDYHNLKPEGIVEFQPREYLEKFRSVIKEPFFDLSEFEVTVNQVIDEYYNDNQKCLSHNDLTRGNFLFTSNDGLKLIDYEYSCYNHYLFDYASFITESLNGTNEAEFLKILNLNKREKAKLDDLMLYALILWINWCNYMFETFSDEIYHTIAKQKYHYLQAFWKQKKKA